MSPAEAAFAAEVLTAASLEGWEAETRALLRLYVEHDQVRSQMDARLVQQLDKVLAALERSRG